MKKIQLNKAYEKDIQKVVDKASELYRGAQPKPHFMKITTQAANEVLDKRLSLDARHIIIVEACRLLGSRGGHRTANLRAAQKQIALF